MKVKAHRSSDGNLMDGAPRRACGCQSCRHRFGPPKERPETFPEYLRRVGDDHLASGHEYTAEDYSSAADRIEELETALRRIVERSSDAFATTAEAVKIRKVPAPLIDEGRAVLNRNPEAA